MPVALSRFDPNGTTGRDLLNRLAFLLEPTRPFDNKQQLWAGVGVPGGSCTGLEGHPIDVDGGARVNPVHSGHRGLSREREWVSRSRSVVRWLKQSHVVCEELWSYARDLPPCRMTMNTAAAAIEVAMIDPALRAPVVEYQTMEYPIAPGKSA